jgi:outer membrane lipoprotein-sorting protein
MGMRFSGITAAVLVAAAAAASGQTAEELIAKSIAARGGLEKIKAVQTMRLTGSMKVGDQKLPSVLELKRPGKSRWEFVFDGETAIQAFDGKTGWMVMPFAGKIEPEVMAESDRKDAEQQADLDGPLVDYKAKGSQITLAGHDAERPKDWKLKVTLKTGEVRYIYLDPVTYLQSMTVMTKNIDGSEVEVKSVIGDYREVGGLVLPHSFTASTKDGRETQALVIDRIELDVPIDDSRFQMPPPKTPRDIAAPTPSVG